MTKFKLSEKSLNRLEGVHEDLVAVVKLAISHSVVDFSVIDGLRTVERQKELYAQGRTKAGNIVTWTMNSPHLLGHAVDLGAIVNGVLSWDKKWYPLIADAMLESAAKLEIPIVWGGTFRDKQGKLRPDSPHFELNKNFYKRK